MDANALRPSSPIGQLVKKLNTIPKVSSIVTYPSMLAILTREKEAGRLQIEPVMLNTGGETLTDDLRKRAQRVFPSLTYGIVDAYGCTECLVMSFVCSHRAKACARRLGHPRNSRRSNAARSRRHVVCDGIADGALQ